MPARNFLRFGKQRKRHTQTCDAQVASPQSLSNSQLVQSSSVEHLGNAPQSKRRKSRRALRAFVGLLRRAILPSSRGRRQSVTARSLFARRRDSATAAQAADDKPDDFCVAKSGSAGKARRHAKQRPKLKSTLNIISKLEWCAEQSTCEEPLEEAHEGAASASPTAVPNASPKQVSSGLCPSAAQLREGVERRRQSNRSSFVRCSFRLSR